MWLWSDLRVVFLGWVVSTPLLANAPTSQLFEVRGNERTRTNYVVELAQACLEDRNEFGLDPNTQLRALEQCLMNAKIFAKVGAKFEGAKIQIDVEEKWTLIPAPFFQSSGSTRKVGLIMFETNFLGQGLTLALGGNSSNKGSRSKSGSTKAGW
ncbi:MAG: hypothetical protein EOP10_27800 [Proteobacteria bacterium]|nr:MAG: hypothetical protein EOP10_27800 [Pseudomonadota bacterium]